MKNCSIETIELPAYLRDFIRELPEMLQAGSDGAERSNFVSIVSEKMAQQINHRYTQGLHVDKLSHDQIRDVLLDLERKIQGDFYVIEEDEDKIVYGNRYCPFSNDAADQNAFCQVSASLFGVIAAENVGYSKVSLEEPRIQEASCCRIVVYLRATPESDSASGKEYFAT